MRFISNSISGHGLHAELLYWENHIDKDEHKKTLIVDKNSTKSSLKKLVLMKHLQTKHKKTLIVDKISTQSSLKEAYTS